MDALDRRGRGLLCGAVRSRDQIADGPFAPQRHVVEMKLATLAPSSSAWHDLLKALARRWEEAAGGELQVRVYPGGAHASEG